MPFSSRGWVPFGVLVVVSVMTTALVLAAVDATQADYAAAAAQTTTSAEPALPLPVVAVAGILALVAGAFSSILQCVEDEEEQ